MREADTPSPNPDPSAYQPPVAEDIEAEHGPSAAAAGAAQSPPQDFQAPPG